jgi:DNA-binding transcriptional LysR family regulator
MSEPSESSIELRSWRQFLMLAQTLHFGRAAQQLSMTQPPLTLAIQQLERRLGVSLFERTRRSVALTPVGALMVEPARQLLEQASAMQARAREAASGELGRVRLGFISTVGFGPLPKWLRAFRQAHPGIAIELLEATSDVQLKAFERGEIDVGFMLHAPGAMSPKAVMNLSQLSLGVEPLVLALPDSWARPRSATPSLYDSVLAFYHHHGATPAIAQEATQMQTIVNLVSAGLGIALVPKAVTQLQRPGVLYRPLPAGLSSIAPHCETSLLWSRDAGSAALRFVDFVKRLLV